MQFADYQALIAEGVLVGLDASLRIKNHGGLCCVNGFIAKPLTSVSPQYPRGAEIDIAIGSGIGTTFLLTIKGSPFLYSQASDLWAAAYLYEQTADGARQDNGDYQFIRDYVVVHELVVNRYERQLQKGSAVWGAFTHPSEQAAPLALLNSQHPSISRLHCDQ